MFAEISVGLSRQRQPAVSRHPATVYQSRVGLPAPGRSIASPVAEIYPAYTVSDAPADILAGHRTLASGRQRGIVSIETR